MSGFPVTVRMYRGILGDCFLLLLGERGDPDRTSILIDCGVLQGVAGGKTRMREVVASIREETGGRLDCVIVTHEHFDHISGFQYAADLFADMTIGTLWLAWTEDPDDPRGQELQERFAAAHQKLAALGVGLALEQQVAAAAEAVPAEAASAGEGDPDDEKRILGLGGFMAPSDDAGALAAGKAARGSRLIFDNLRSWAKEAVYLSPGDVLPTPGKRSLTAYVLGPPREDRYLFKSLPSSGEARETYLGLSADVDLGKASGRSPFAAHYRWFTLAGGGGKATADAAAVPEFVAQHYLSDEAPCRFAGTEKPEGHRCAVDFLCRRKQDYRRIDDMAKLEESSLALKMDSNTNNSSLVIVFELPDSTGMIFAADAQVGNWLSWEKVEFKDRITKEKLPVTSGDLLARARLYKVGHHGSHNATLKAKGLDLMTHPDLVAMIPTVEDIALEQGKKGWLMPNPETYKGLILRSRGRIIRGDKSQAEVARGIDDLVAAERHEATREDRISEFERFERVTLAAVDETDPLFVDYRIC